MKLKEISLTAKVATVVLTGALATSIIISTNTNYNTTKDSVTNEVIVEDTTDPKVELNQRVVFTNDIANLEDFSSIVKKISDTSEYTTKLIRFEKEDHLYEVNDLAIKNLLSSIQLPGIEEKLEFLGTEDVPTEEGIYRAVLEIADVHGNRTLEEIYVVYDTTGARIDDTPDKTIYVDKADLDKEPEIDKTEYSITDNVDGKIHSDNIICELELRDAEKHEWLVHVSYVDRAGNKSKADFLIIVKKKSEKKEETSNQNNDSGTSDDAANAGAANSTDTDNNVVTDENTSSELTPSQQAVINAGYGVVVQFASGNYGVLTHGDGYVNGVFGADILWNYLENQSLTAQTVMGGWISSANDWYWFIAYNPSPIDTSGNEW